MALFRFGADFWMLSLMITLYYAAIFPFQSFATYAKYTTLDFLCFSFVHLPYVF